GSFTGRRLIGGLVVAVLAVMLPLESCGSISNNGGLDGGDSDGRSAPNLGASYTCSATATCIVGQSYCDVTVGGAAGAPGSNTGYYTTGFCRAIPQGTACAANPTCACVCAARGCFSYEMCS